MEKSSSKEEDPSAIQKTDDLIDDEGNQNEGNNDVIKCEEENSISKPILFLSHMVIQDEQDQIKTESFENMQNEFTMKEKIPTDFDMESINLQDVITHDEVKPQLLEKVFHPISEPTRRSKRRINIPLRDSPPRVSGRSISDEHSIAKPKSLTMVPKKIREGDEFQVSVVPIEEWDPPVAGCSSNLDVDRDECVWRPDDELLDPRDLDEFCQTLQRHRDADIPESMKLLYDKKYDRLKALEAIDELPLAQSSPWSKEEIDIFYSNLSKPGKNFRRLLKELPEKKMSDLIEFYYRVKKAKCFTSPNFSFCDKLGNSTTDEMPTLSSDSCENCTKMLWQTEGRLEVKNRRKVKLCYACELYYKISKCYRPCRKVSTLDEEQKPTLKTFSKLINILPKAHLDCFFSPRIEKLSQTIEWSSEDTLKCVQGFHRFGKDFEKIADFLDVKSPEIVEEFYEMNQSRYRLDFLISLYDKEQMGEVCNKNARSIIHDDYEDFDSDRSRESRSNRKDTNKSSSSMITRNQKKRTIDVIY